MVIGLVAGAVVAAAALFTVVYLEYRLSGGAGQEVDPTNDDGMPPWVLFFYPVVLLGAVAGGWVALRLARRGRAASA